MKGGTRRMGRSTSSPSLFPRDFLCVSRAAGDPSSKGPPESSIGLPPRPLSCFCAPIGCSPQKPVALSCCFPPVSPLFFALVCCRSAHKTPSEAERGKGLSVSGATARSAKKRGSKGERVGGEACARQGGARAAIVNRRAGWMWKGSHVWDTPGRRMGAMRPGRRTRGGNLFGGINGGIFFVFGDKLGGGGCTWIEEQPKVMCGSSMMRLPASLSLPQSRRRDRRCWASQVNGSVEIRHAVGPLAGCCRA